MAAIVIRQVGPYTITCVDGDVFCNGVETAAIALLKPLANGAVATVDTLCKGANGKHDIVSLQPDQLRLITAAKWAREDRKQAEWARAHASEIAALNELHLKADTYERAHNEGGEGYNPYREQLETDFRANAGADR